MSRGPNEEEIVDKIRKHTINLGHEDRDVRKNAVNELHRIGVHAVPLLRDALKDVNLARDKIRFHNIVMALKKIGSKNSENKEILQGLYSDLLNNLGHKDLAVRQNSVGEFVRSGVPVVPLLRAALKNANLARDRIRFHNIVMALKKIGSKNSENKEILQGLYSDLLNNLGHEEQAIRRNSGEELVSFGVSAVPLLRFGLKDATLARDRIRFHDIVLALQKIGSKNSENKEILQGLYSDLILDLGHKEQAIRRNAGEVFVSVGVNSVPLLRAALKNANLARDRIRFHDIVLALQKIGSKNPENKEILQGLYYDLLNNLGHEEQAIRRNSGEELVSFGVSAVPLLRFGLKDATLARDRIRFHDIVLALKKIGKANQGNKEILQGLYSDLLNNLGHKDLAVRQNSVGEFVRSGVPVVPLLRDALKDVNLARDKIRFHNIVLALKKIGAKYSGNKEILQGLYSDLTNALGNGNRVVQNNAGEELVKIGVPAIPVLIDGLEGEIKIIDVPGGRLKDSFSNRKQRAKNKIMFNNIVVALQRIGRANQGNKKVLDTIRSALNKYGLRLKL